MVYEPTIDQSRRNQLIDKGYCVFPRLLDVGLLQRVQRVSRRLLDGNSAEEKRRRGHQGNVISLAYQDPVFSELIALPAALEALAALGFARPRYFGGAIIAKEAGSPPLYWHQDWTYWGEPESADPIPHQVFLMWYLTDTSRPNGCLRVVPGSHRMRLDAHDRIGTHDDGIRNQNPETSAGYQPLPGEVDVPVTAGDLVIGDARVLHAAHAKHHRPAAHGHHLVVRAALRRTQRESSGRLPEPGQVDAGLGRGRGKRNDGSCAGGLPRRRAARSPDIRYQRLPAATVIMLRIFRRRGP